MWPCFLVQDQDKERQPFCHSSRIQEKKCIRLYFSSHLQWVFYYPFNEYFVVDSERIDGFNHTFIRVKSVWRHHLLQNTDTVNVGNVEFTSRESAKNISYLQGAHKFQLNSWYICRPSLRSSSFDRVELAGWSQDPFTLTKILRVSNFNVDSNGRGAANSALQCVPAVTCCSNRILFYFFPIFLSTHQSADVWLVLSCVAELETLRLYFSSILWVKNNTILILTSFFFVILILKLSFQNFWFPKISRSLFLWLKLVIFGTGIHTDSNFFKSIILTIFVLVMNMVVMCASRPCLQALSGKSTTAQLSTGNYSHSRNSSENVPLKLGNGQEIIKIEGSNCEREEPYCSRCLFQ